MNDYNSSLTNITADVITVPNDWYNNDIIANNYQALSIDEGGTLKLGEMEITVEDLAKKLELLDILLKKEFPEEYI